MDPKPRRPWLRYSLKTLFLVMTAASLFLGYLGLATHWVRERREILEGRRRYLVGESVATDDEGERNVVAGCYGADGPPPMLLRPFEEFGVKDLYLGKATEAEFQRALELFPETPDISYWDDIGDDQGNLISAVGLPPNRVWKSKPMGNPFY